MTYRVIILPAARRQIERLPGEIRTRVSAHISLLEVDPRPPGYKKLKGIDGYRIRVGDYRIIYTIDDEIVTITIIRVGHRREVYC